MFAGVMFVGQPLCLLVWCLLVSHCVYRSDVCWLLNVFVDVISVVQPLCWCDVCWSGTVCSCDVC